MVNPAGDVAEIGIIPNQRVQGKSFIVWSCAPRRKAAGVSFYSKQLNVEFCDLRLACFVVRKKTEIVLSPYAAFARFANYAKSR